MFGANELLDGSCATSAPTLAKIRGTCGVNLYKAQSAKARKPHRRASRIFISQQSAIRIG